MERDKRNPEQEPTAAMVDADWQTFIDVIEQFRTTEDFESILNVYCKAARKLVGADGVTFVRRDGDFCRYVDEDAVGPLWKGKTFPMSACISGWCMLSGKTAVIPDIYKDDRIPHFAYKPTFVKSLVMAPVRIVDPIAAIGAYWAVEQQPTRYAVTLLETLGQTTADAIAAAHAAERSTEKRTG